jgi:hypothetical protein
MSEIDQAAVRAEIAERLDDGCECSPGFTCDEHPHVWPEGACWPCLLRAAGAAETVEAERAACAANERMVLERLSRALTGSNASTWDELFHAAEAIETRGALSRAEEGRTP